MASKRSRRGATTTELAKRVEKSRVRSLLQVLNSSVDSTGDHALITSRITDNLDRFIPFIRYPHDVYESVICFLIQRSCLPAAVAVHERMVGEGYIASPSLEAQMIIVAMTLAHRMGRKVFYSSLKTIIRNPFFTNDDLLALLNSMTELDFSPQILNATMTDFYKIHRDNDTFDPDIDFYDRMMNLKTRSGNIQQALDALLALPESNVRQKDIPRAYKSFIAGVRDTQHWDREAVSVALNMMEQQGIEPDITVFNALISFEVRNNSLRRAFAIYDALKNHPRVLPDDFTFGSLFNCLNRLYNPNRRQFRQGRRLSDHVLSPRMLYRDMIEALVRRPEAPAFHLTTSLLNVALRSFIYKKDYVGAYVVVRCFTAFHATPNVKTYLIVIRHLMNRITYGIRAVRKIGDDKWADRFLGLPYPICNSRFLSDLQLSNALASRILGVSSRSSFHLTWPLYITEGAPHEQEPTKYHVPTVENMLSRDPVPLDHPFDPVPLERLLKKAILAELDSMRELDHGWATNLYLSRVIAGAKEEMVPPNVNEQLRECRIGERR